MVWDKEDAAMKSGKLDEELSRMSEIVDLYNSIFQQDVPVTQMVAVN